MAPAARWSLRIVGGLVALIVLLSGFVYIKSEMVLAQTYHFRENPVALATDSASIARGEHIARMSCYGCHSDSLRGKVFFSDPKIARLVSPNVIEKIKSYSDAELAGFLRYGVRKDGSSPFIMPPPGFYHLSDEDLGALLGFLRQEPEAQSPELPKVWYGPLGRIGLATGKFTPSTVQIDTTVARVGADPAYRTTREGEYFARVLCSECHGTKLTGDPQFDPQTPALVGALGYSLPEFTQLLREGKPRGSNTLTLMAEVAKENLHNLTDAEIAAIHGYLKSLPATGVVLR